MNTVNEMTPPAATMNSTRPFYWSVRRELWEYRSIYIAPLVVAAVAILGFFVATIGRAMASSDLAQRRAILVEPYSFATAIILFAAFIVSIFYSLDALYGERRDRSILFWKSLPVSDLTTVLAKTTVALVVIPLVGFVITVGAQLLMGLLSTAVLAGSGLSISELWAQLVWLQVSLLYHLLTIHMLWYAPLYAWFLLVSAWARRAPFLWAGLPPLVIAGLEKIAFNTTHFLSLLHYRLRGPEEFHFPKAHASAMGSMLHLEPGVFFSAPGLWIGLIVAALFLAAAVRVRRYHGPI